MADGVPAAVVGAAEDAEQLGRVDAAAPGDAVLAVADGKAMSPGRSARPAPICAASWPEQRHPDAELALALQRVGLPVDAADQHHVAVEAPAGPATSTSATCASKSGSRDPLALRGQQLDEVGAALVGALAARRGRARGAGRRGVRRGWGPGVRNGHGCLLVTPGRVPVRGGAAPGRRPARDHPGGDGHGPGGPVIVARRPSAWERAVPRPRRSGQRSLLPGKGRSPVRSGSTVAAGVPAGCVTGGGVVDGAVVVSGSGVTADAAVARVCAVAGVRP